MADIVNTSVLFEGVRRYNAHITNQSDGTGESAVTKVDMSTLTGPNGGAATYSTVDFIEYDIGGFNYIVLAWDADTDDEIAVLSGQGVVDWYATGGKTDPKTTGTTGDIKLTTDGALDGAHYDITIWMRARD